MTTSIPSLRAIEIAFGIAVAFQAQRAAWRVDGTPRTARRLTVSTPGPLPPPAARRCCLLPALQTSALQGGHGRLCGRVQGHAHPRMHGLLPALLAAWRARGEAPARSLPARAQRPPPRPGGTARV